MDWQALLIPEIKNFLDEHQNSDVRTLALKKPPNPDWPYALILDQIKTRQKAKVKAPSWLEYNNIIFPPSDTFEQASSEPCAKYKASLFKGKAFADLTGGAGIDSWAMLENFDQSIIIEVDINAAERIAHNLRILNNKLNTTYNTYAEDFIPKMDEVDLVLIDPQRRNTKRKGLYKLEECSPNILDLLPSIKAKTILLKTSPMLDINLAIEQLGCVTDVHIIEWQNECKELLFILKPSTKTNEKQTQSISITAITINDDATPEHKITFTREDENETKIEYDEPQNYLYEPSPAFIKSGAYKTIAKHYALKKLHPHTHLYTSQTQVKNFPGRSFQILKTYPAQAKAIPLKKANLKVRNFPQDTATLKKKLKLKDGGDDYLFACTTTDKTTNKNTHIVIHCHKKNI